ncbi:MAG: hypothetical protein HKO59_03445, partial [Phycisphaerales bacterium]|nr:hypothetical protein [Phycisphaerales bacterium]
MTSFGPHSLQLLKRLLGVEASAPAHAGVETVLDGLTAVAVTEAAGSDTAALGATWPAAAGGRAWSRRQRQQRRNRLGAMLTA